jgi:hypothetical protein
MPIAGVPADAAALGSPQRGPSRSDAAKEGELGFDQYHEPPDELSAETRTFARMVASLTEEAEAIGWYEQRIAVEQDAQAKAIMENAQEEEFKHFGMDLEFLLRRTPKWQAALKEILFSEGDIVEAGERGEHAEDDA